MRTEPKTPEASRLVAFIAELNISDDIALQALADIGALDDIAIMYTRLAADPGGPYTARRVEEAADDWWSVDDANGEGIALCGEDDARRIAALLNQTADPGGLRAALGLHYEATEDGHECDPLCADAILALTPEATAPGTKP